jgi:hypothetical protein
MNAKACFIQALRQTKLPADRLEEADAVMKKWVAPYLHRDSTVDTGKVLVDEVDPETLGHGTVEKQLHPARQVRPFVFGPAEVQDLARNIRRELKLR